MSQFIKHALTTTGSRILLISMSFIQGIIIARFLLPEGRGLIAAYLAVVMMLLPLSELGIKQSSSFFLNQYKYSVQEILNIQSLILIFSSLLTGLALIFIYYMQYESNSFIITMILLSVPLRIYISYSTGIALGTREINLINLSQLILTSIDLLFVVIMFIFLQLNVQYYFIGYFISSLVAGLYIHYWLRKKYTFTIKLNFRNFLLQGIPVIKKGVTYALPLFVIGINYSSDILILNYFVDKTQIGIYSVGVTLAVLIWQLPDILALLIFSYSVSSTDKYQFSQNLWKKTKLIMLILLPVAIIIAMTAKYLIPFIYGVSFTASYEVLVLLMPGVYMMIAYKLLNGDLAARGHPMAAFKIFTLGAVINIILNFYLIPKMGINGAALASSISYTLSAIFYVTTYRSIIFNLKGNS